MLRVFFREKSLICTCLQLYLLEFINRNYLRTGEPRRQTDRHPSRLRRHRVKFFRRVSSAAYVRETQRNTMGFATQ
jgi:hypothetical protein